MDPAIHEREGFDCGVPALDEDHQGRGLGKLLLACAIDHALLVDAKDDAARAFYMHFGFKTLQEAQLTLCLPLGR